MIPVSEWLNSCTDQQRVVAWVQGQAISVSRWRAEVAFYTAHYQQQSSSRYLLWCQSAFRFSVQLFALWHAGKIVVMPPNAQPESLQGLLGEVDALVTDVERVRQQCQSDIPVHWADADVMADSPASEFHRLDSGRACLILYTSGSTGQPKAVGRNLVQLQAELNALHQQFGADFGSVTVVGAVPHQHIYGLLFRVLWPLMESWPFIDEVIDYPEPLLERLPPHQPVLLIASPAQLTRFPDQYDWATFAGAVLHCFSSGAPLPIAAATLLHEKTGRAPIEVLGSTETGGVAFRQCSAFEQAWQTLPGVEIEVRESEELWVRSPASSVQGWFAIGDRAERLDEQRFVLRGRADRIVKVEGKRLSLTEMEQRLLQLPEIDQCALTVCYHNRDIVAAVIVLAEQGRTLLEHQGRRAMNEHWRHQLLPHFERVLLPRWFRYVDALPTDSRGKVTQQALQSLFSEQALP